MSSSGLSARERRRLSRTICVSIRISADLHEEIDAEVARRREAMIALGVPPLDAEKGATRSGVMAEAIRRGLRAGTTRARE